MVQGAILKISIAEIQSAIKKRFQIESFRAGQFEIIQDVLLGHNVCASIPTGAGKSLVYQSMAFLLKSVVVVVEPYISLIRDQMSEAAALDLPAAAIHSDMTDAELESLKENIGSSKLRLLFVTPERFADTNFTEFLLRINVGRIMVDEAHSIVSMGESFRPAYGALGSLVDGFNFEREALGFSRVPVTFLSATLTPDIIGKIKRKFGFSDVKEHIIRSRRTNIRIGMERMSNDQKFSRVLDAARKVSEYGATLIYVSCKITAKTLYDRFKLRGLDVGIHHASLSSKERVDVLEWYKKSARGVLITTSALSAGYNKPNIRAVVHFHPPRTIEDYAQEIGRAGRDGEPAEAFCLYDPVQDKRLNESLLKSSSPDATIVAAFAFFVAEKLKETASVRVSADLLKMEYGLRDITHGALKTLLSHARIAGALDFIEDGRYFDIVLYGQVKTSKLVELIVSNDDNKKRFEAMSAMMEYEGCKHEYMECYLSGLPLQDGCPRCSCCYDNEVYLSENNLTDAQIRTRLITLRSKRSKGFGVPAFSLIPAEAVEQLVRLKPKNLDDLNHIKGLDISRIRFVGEDIIKAIHS